MEQYRATALILVPRLLRRMVDLDPALISSTDLSRLRINMVAGATLSPELGNRTLDVFGDVLHNMYGATEISVATVAMPQDWRAAPGTIGRPPSGCEVALFDRDGVRITEPGVTGRAFVSSPLNFNSDGLFCYDGRDDDMIVSGGENVYPVEIENLLAEQEDVVEAAVVGVPDEELKSFVRANLARLKVPREIVFLDELPRNATGKLLRRRLGELDAN